MGYGSRIYVYRMALLFDIVNATPVALVAGRAPFLRVAFRPETLGADSRARQTVVRDRRRAPARSPARLPAAGEATACPAPNRGTSSVHEGLLRHCRMTSGPARGEKRFPFKALFVNPRGSRGVPNRFQGGSNPVPEGFHEEPFGTPDRPDCVRGPDLLPIQKVGSNRWPDPRCSPEEVCFGLRVTGLCRHRSATRRRADCPRASPHRSGHSRDLSRRKTGGPSCRCPFPRSA